MKKIILLLLLGLVFLLPAEAPAFFDSGNIPGYDWLEFENLKVEDNGRVTVTIENNSDRMATFHAKILYADMFNNVFGHSLVVVDVPAKGSALDVDWIKGDVKKCRHASQIIWNVTYAQ